MRQYEGESISAVGQVVVSDDPGAFLSQLSTMSAFNDLQGSLFADYSTELKALDLRREATAKRAAEVAATEGAAGRGEGHHRRQARRGQGAARRARGRGARGDALAQRPRPRRLPLPRAPRAAASGLGRRGAAVGYAMAQVGDAYVYGAAGPSAFDCSGLTMMAWAAAGVCLPHSSSAQYGSGPHIAASDLQPGDLVFYYSPISHVGMYIGNGMIVHAANPGTGVPGLRSLLDAVRRRGPPWLTAPTPKAGRPRWWVAGLSLSLLLVAGLLVWVALDDDALRRRPAVGAGGPGPARAGGRRRCARSSEAVEDRDPRAARRPGARRRRPRPRALLASVVDNAARARASRDFTLRYVDEDGRASRRTGPGRPRSTRPGGFDGFDDAPARAEVTVRLRRRRRPRWRSRASAAATTAPRCGCRRRSQVRRTAGTLVLAAGTPAQADALRPACRGRRARRAPGAAGLAARAWSSRCRRPRRPSTAPWPPSPGSTPTSRP